MSNQNESRIVVKEGEHFFSVEVKDALQGITTDEENPDVIRVSKMNGSLTKITQNGSYFLCEYLIPSHKTRLRVSSGHITSNSIPNDIISSDEYNRLMNVIGKHTKNARRFKLGGSTELNFDVYFDDLILLVVSKKTDNGKLQVGISGSNDAFPNVQNWLAIHSKHFKRSESVCLPNIYHSNQSNVCWGSGNSKMSYSNFRDLPDILDYFFDGKFNSDLSGKSFTKEQMTHNLDVIRQYIELSDNTELKSAVTTILKAFEDSYIGINRENRRQFSVYPFVIICDALKIPINLLRSS